MAATATRSRTRSSPPAAARPGDVQAALERALAAVEADERLGPRVAAVKPRMRFELTDTGVSLDLEVAEGGAGLRWSAGDPGWQPQVTLAMAAEVANRFLLGRESLAIALARGRARVSGDPRAALRCLAASRLIAERYRDVVEAEFPELFAPESESG